MSAVMDKAARTIDVFARSLISAVTDKAARTIDVFTRSVDHGSDG